MRKYEIIKDNKERENEENLKRKRGKISKEKIKMKNLI